MATTRLALVDDDQCPVPAAIPNDGLDDRAAIQAALAAQGCAQLVAGTYDIATPTFTPPARRIYDMLSMRSGYRLVGAGASVTMIRFAGDAGGQDWRGIGISGDGVSVRDLSFDTAALTGTSEQTHVIHVAGPATGTTIERITFRHPQRAGLPGGDCVQLVGYAGTPVVGARIRNNDFLCDRSGVAGHSGVHDLEITGNVIRAGDQPFDGEGSGGNDGILIAHNVFPVGPGEQGDTAIQIQSARNVRITDNIFEDRGIFLYGCSGCEIDHNAMMRTTGVSGVGVVEIGKDSADVRVHDNTLERAASAGLGYVIRAAVHGSGTPARVTIADNRLIQHASGDVINTAGVVGLHVERNLIDYDGASSGSYAVLINGSTLTRTDDISVIGNTFTGPLAGCVGLSGSYAGTGTVTLTGNLANGPIHGLICGNVYDGAKLLGPVTASGNAWPLAVCGTPSILQAP